MLRAALLEKPLNSQYNNWSKLSVYIGVVRASFFKATRLHIWVFDHSSHVSCLAFGVHVLAALPGPTDEMMWG